MTASLSLYVDAALALHDLHLTPAARDAVLLNFERSAAIAEVFLAVPLTPEDEMAPVFAPVAAP